MADLIRNPWVIIGVVMLFLIGGSVWYSSEVSKSYNEGVVEITHIKGNPEATVTLVKYSDFQCPACKEFSGVVSDVMEAYGDEIAFEYKHFPLIQIHPHAEAAARAAEAAGQQGKFYEFHDLLFENQEEWSRSVAPGAFFVRYAEALELDLDLFNRHQRSSIIRDKVRAELMEARDQGLTSTPTFFLNGERMVIETYPDFIEQIEQAIGITTTAEGDTATTTTPAIQFGI